MLIKNYKWSFKSIETLWYIENMLFSIYTVDSIVFRILVYILLVVKEIHSP
jgi:hypothetical protein